MDKFEHWNQVRMAVSELLEHEPTVLVPQVYEHDGLWVYIGATVRRRRSGAFWAVEYDPQSGVRKIHTVKFRDQADARGKINELPKLCPYTTYTRRHDLDPREEQSSKYPPITNDADKEIRYYLRGLMTKKELDSAILIFQAEGVTPSQTYLKLLMEKLEAEEREERAHGSSGKRL